VQELLAFGFFDRIDADDSSVVYGSPSTSILDPLSLPVSPSTPSTTPTKPRLKRPPVTLPTSLTPAKPKQWRDVGEEVKGLFFHATIKSYPHVKGFTLRLSDHVESLARAKGRHCLAWLHRRVVRELKRAVCHPQAKPVPFWFAIEEADDGALHIHGEIAFDPTLSDKVRTALKSAGGKWLEQRRGVYQLRFDNCDFRGAGYFLKNVHKARPSRRRLMRRYDMPRRWVAAFRGKAVTANSDVSKAAIVIHSLWRDKISQH
jgi:hypothetical protein